MAGAAIVGQARFRCWQRQAQRYAEPRRGFYGSCCKHGGAGDCRGVAGGCAGVGEGAAPSVRR
eukprot:7369292-Alexandrium_andersonii.AAC.1